MDIVNELLDDLEVELKEDSSFNGFLESLNVNLLIEGDETENKPASEEETTKENDNNTNTAEDTNKNIKGNISKLAEMCYTKCKGWFEGVDGYITKHMTSMSESYKKLSEKFNSNSKVKLAGDMASTTIDFLKVPKLVCKAGDDFEFVGKHVDQWMNGVFSGLKREGQNIKNNAKKGMDAAKHAKDNNDQTKAGFLQGILNACSSLVSGLGGALKSVSNTFAGIWKGVKESLGGQAKTESSLTFITLDEEVEYLLS